MISRQAAAVVAFTVTSVSAGIATSAPAVAGGVGDFLSPAFAVTCVNHTGARTSGATTHGTGTASSNLVGLPLGSALNQCGGADASKITEIDQNCENRQGAQTGAGILNVPVNANVLQCSDDLAKVGILSSLVG
ncbi:hypothetical protein [Streptomyces chrestomyceticus]|uniref:hypothetical protein n=1 Tax=Streptomyces chrestomyceticus TaxID=68185 RepID=UPI0033FC8316